MENEIIKQTAQALKLNYDQISVISRFPGGMSNYTYHVKTPTTELVARIVGPGGEVFVNREIELFHLRLVEPLNITTKTIYFDLESGFKLSSYLPGVVLSNQITSDDYHGVADTLKMLHQAGLIGHDYDLINRLNYYESLIKYRLSDQYYKLKEKWIKLYQSFYAKFDKVMCHGDAQRSNLVKYQNKIYLLDLEFSGMNDPYFDIASFGNINFDDSVCLLEAYLGVKPNLDQLNRLRFNRAYQVLQWHLVATYKHDINLSEKLNIPFLSFATKYLNFAQTLFSLMGVTNED